ncbi:polysaccharide pyruvyl transferase family protein [Cellulomonas sp. PhB143]|uniref:polysaccharide pyruvyl transferase family protein n=1 Tax=Cellulomonas sp. PhB143 TaxID=2485186 RepID=UPI000FA3E77C|nr:polysaccharide pyruvyl transferase family protein [Cellulomonas sp. PhB143]ROS78535.1 polysaccharide pyruvyl transferase [Cellulomonas sp. PhB143]
MTIQNLTDLVRLEEPATATVPQDLPTEPPTDVVVCSFYTADSYYRAFADELRGNLERLGIAYELEEVVALEGQDWADICRRKVGFLARVCEAHPDSTVFWIDVDCGLHSLPGYVRRSTADLIGFQRGFSSPLTIGYANRTRFWEPCFFGVAPTAAARRWIADAARLERTASIKATDDYFFEESWRANAASLTFQVIPSAAVTSRAAGAEAGVEPFFTFGSSGNVDDFKGRVTQHGQVGERRSASVWTRGRRSALRVAKSVERALPAGVSNPVRRTVDRIGVTHALTGGGADALSGIARPGGSPHRVRIVREMVAAGQAGDLERMEGAYHRIASASVPDRAEVAAYTAAGSFAHFATIDPGQDPLRLAWWARPFPGNFGDWLSPLVLAAQAERSVLYQSPTARSSQPHLISVGSIGRFVRPDSIVVGTGISSDEIELEPSATYLSVRGPVTAALLEKSGGPAVGSFGDPGALLRRAIPVERGETNGRTALVRHFTHIGVPLTLPESMDELSVLRSHPTAVRDLVEQLATYDAVVTSAMHVMIACHSYGIPCVLVTFEGMESSVHGTGIKYRDYSLGVGLDRVHEPITVPRDLRMVPVASMLTDDRIGDDKLDEIEQAVAGGVAAYRAAVDGA